MTYLVDHTLKRDIEGFTRWLDLAGFTYGAMTLTPQKITLTDLDHSSGKYSLSPNMALKDQERARSVEVWLKLGAPAPADSTSHRVWLRKVRKIAKANDLGAYPLSSLILAEAGKRIKNVRIPADLARLHERTTRALAELEKIYAGKYVPDSTAEATADLRLAHEHLTNRLWEASELSENVLLSEECSRTFDVLRSMVDALEARAVAIRSEFLDLESTECVQELAASVDADAAMLAMLTKQSV